MNYFNDKKMEFALVLQDLLKFWFQHVKADERLTLPAWEDNKPWFIRDAGFDEKCVYVLRSLERTLMENILTSM